MTTWTVAVNGEIKPTGQLERFETKKACKAYIDRVYFGSIKNILNIKPVKIKIEIV